VDKKISFWVKRSPGFRTRLCVCKEDISIQNRPIPCPKPYYGVAVLMLWHNRSKRNYPFGRVNTGI
jgi:hypothetical protein